ncbi:hypothetical protein FHS94_003663 [Sphingomonas aerophila]|uniref:Uncharacterized protein n=1 Tax=Sphingomonas aerophila TaxID=1344948 RepID=A0A7W9BGH7_9SPHN|nr:hypothetical protein [Sphingomonas aerophila]
MVGLLLAVLAIQVGIGPSECTRPSPDDARPFTLCLAETSNNEIERELQRQLTLAIRRVRSTSGGLAVSRLVSEQRRWDRQRHRVCADQALDAPMPEQARADLTCLYNAAQLKDRAPCYAGRRGSLTIEKGNRESLPT